MLKVEFVKDCATTPEFGPTLWHCNQCNAFISIFSARALEEVFCPACGDVLLEYCGCCGAIPWSHFADA